VQGLPRALAAVAALALLLFVLNAATGVQPARAETGVAPPGTAKSSKASTAAAYNKRVQRRRIARTCARRVARKRGLTKSRRRALHRRCTLRLLKAQSRPRRKPKPVPAPEPAPAPAPTPPPAPAPEPEQIAPPPSSTTGTQTFAEECNGETINPAKWVSEWGVYFGTDADFMGDMRQISMGGGNCTITAEKKPTPSGRAWASGLMSTHDRFSQAYGRFEIRAKLPKGKGMWPAFWLLPQATRHGPPEIDVMEVWANPIGSTPVDASSTSSAIHYCTTTCAVSYDSSKMHSTWYKGPDVSQDFHTYAVDWRPGSITMLVDGVERGRMTSNVPSVPMYLIVNLAVGSTWAGRPDATTPSPSRMQIDYMRVYR
jgi:hypothetical protein